jgi:hypothetical protein
MALIKKDVCEYSGEEVFLLEIVGTLGYSKRQSGG